VELFFEQEIERETSWSEGRPKMVSSGVGSGVSVRVLKGGRQGFASGTDTSAEGLRSLFDHARESAQATFPDKARRFIDGDGKSGGSSRGVDRNLVMEFPLLEKVLLGRLKVLEQQALRGIRD
jgi:predicted Zn-dependent protease